MRRLLTYGLIVLVLLGIGGGSWVGYEQLNANAKQLQAKIIANLEHAQQDLEAAKATLEVANTKRDAGLAFEAVLQFQFSGGEFAQAAKLADQSQLLHYAELAPSIGQQVHAKRVAVDLISDMGVQLSEAGIQLGQLDAELIKPTPSGAAGRTFLTVVNETSASLNNVRASLIQAQADAARVDLDLLPKSQQATLVEARSSIDAGVQALNEFARLAPVLVEILGGNGARTYLVEQVNPAELRAGGGFIGSYSVIRADHGVISIVRSGNSYDLVEPRPAPGQPGFIPQPTPFREIVPYISWSFVDSNIYPDFPSNAKAAIQFLQPRLGKLDGVIAFDYFTVAKMLDLTGPISVPGFGITVNSGSFISQLIKLDISAGLGHKTILAAIAGPLMARISSLPSEKWPNLVNTLNSMAGQRHVQGYFTNVAVEEEMDRIGWSGVINPSNASEYFMEVEDNYWGNKDNYFLTRHYVITLTRSGNTLRQTVEVDLTNRTPASSSTRPTYRSVIRLYVHGGMTGQSNNLQRPAYANPKPPAGFGMIDGWIYVPCCGSKGTAVLSFSSPWAPDSRGSEKIYWQKQPGTLNDAVTVIWNAGRGQTFTASGSLTGDLVINLGPTAVSIAAGQPGQATLPTLSLG